jgi:hypothetical protein
VVAPSLPRSSSPRRASTRACSQSGASAISARSSQTRPGAGGTTTSFLLLNHSRPPQTCATCAIDRQRCAGTSNGCHHAALMPPTFPAVAPAWPASQSHSLPMGFPPGLPVWTAEHRHPTHRRHSLRPWRGHSHRRRTTPLPLSLNAGQQLRISLVAGSAHGASPDNFAPTQRRGRCVCVGINSRLARQTAVRSLWRRRFG